MEFLPGPLPNLSLNEPLLQILQAVLFVALLLSVAVIDVRTRIIPNGLCLTVALTALLHFSPTQLLGVLSALPLLLAACCGGRQGIGGGDIKLTAAAGAVLGLYGGMLGLSLGLAATLIFFGLRNLVRIGRKKPPQSMANTALSLGPFLALGFLITYFINFGGITL